MKDPQYKRKDILERIKRIEDALLKAREYLDTGTHAHWQGFKPVFSGEASPHKDWVKNFFIPSREKSLRRQEKLLDTLR